MAANECGKVVIVRWPCPDQLAPKFGAPSTEHFFAQPHIRNELKIFRYKSMGIFGLKLLCGSAIFLRQLMFHL